MTTKGFRSLDELRQLVEAFESTRLGKDAWNHRAHLAIAAWYVCHCLPVEARHRMVRGIKRYNAARGIVQTPTGGYHETMTVFWLTAVEATVGSGYWPDVLAAANGVVTRLADKELVFAYYDREALFSSKARYAWVPPNRYPCGALSDISDALATRWSSLSQANATMGIARR